MDAFVKFFGSIVLVAGGLFLAMLLGPVFGALSGWFIGLTPIGGWVAQGGRAIGLTFNSHDLWAIGAFMGFITPGFRAQKG